MEAVMFSILEISNVFHNTCSFENWGILPGYSKVAPGAYSVM